MTHTRLRWNFLISSLRLLHSPLQPLHSIHLAMMSLVRLLAFALVAAFSYLYLNPDARKFLAEAPASEIFQAALEVPAVASVHAALVSRGLSADRLASLAKSLPFLEKFVPASTSPGASPPRRQPCILHGEEETGACDLSNVEELNTRHVYPLLSQIVRMPFFQVSSQIPSHTLPLPAYPPDAYILHNNLLLTPSSVL